MKGGGNIVQTEGGHIVRSTGRKDRHSKVYTSKGPRDRRVRLSAHTAIQFYDVQDRLGYDRPSKAVDWLIKKAKTAIDNLNELAPPPPWHPNDINLQTPDNSNPNSNQQSENPSGYALIQPDSNPSCSNLPFMAPSVETEAHLVDTMKSLFPTTFPGFSNDSVSRASFQGEDNLGLSLHSFQADDNQGNSNNQNFPFQESFRTIDGWNGNIDSRVGFFMNSLENSHLSSNLAVNPWNQRPLASTDQHKSSDFDSDFELGFRVPARIYGDEEAENHR